MKKCFAILIMCLLTLTICFAAPVESPVASPIESPVESPVNPPVEAPTDTPVIKNFFITNKSEIAAAIISFVVALFTTLLTHFLGNFKLRYTEKLKITSELSKRKYEGIRKIREEIRTLSHYENLCVTEDEESLIPENIGKKIYTPACCYSHENLLNTSSILNDLHGEFGHCLRHTSVIYLVYFRNFLLDYALKCSRAGLSDEVLRWVSVPLYEEIHKWYKQFDKELIRSMNRPSMKYFAHSGLKYNFLLKVYGWYFNRTKLCKYMKDEQSVLNQMILNPDKIIAQYEETVTEKSDEIVSELS